MSVRTLPLLRQIETALPDRPFRLELWDGSTLPSTNGGGGPSFRARSRAAVGHAVRAPGQLGLGRAYVSGALEVDDLDATLGLLDGWRRRRWTARACGAGRRGAAGRGADRRPRPPRGGAAPARPAPRVERDMRAVRHHYDVSNEYFALFLDESMTYSARSSRAAHDARGGAGAKLALVSDKLAIGEGERVLDVGCGWGSFDVRPRPSAARASWGSRCRSPRPRSPAARAQEAGVAERIDIRVMDYRGLRGETFDTIVSIGMVEHVGSANIDAYARRAARAAGAGRARCSTTASRACATPIPRPARSPSATCSRTPRRCTCRASSRRSSAPACGRARRGLREGLRRDPAPLGAALRRQPRRGGAPRRARSGCACGASTCAPRGAASRRGFTSLPGARHGGLTAYQRCPTKLGSGTSSTPNAARTPAAISRASATSSAVLAPPRFVERERVLGGDARRGRVAVARREPGALDEPRRRGLHAAVGLGPRGRTLRRARPRAPRRPASTNGFVKNEPALTRVGVGRVEHHALARGAARARRRARRPAARARPARPPARGRARRSGPGAARAAPSRRSPRARRSGRAAA